MSSENRYLGAPILSLQVMLRVLAQAEGEISGVIPDGIYGMLSAIRCVFPQMPELSVTGVHDAASVRAVRWFQRKCGLSEDGVLTQIDWLYLAGLYRLTIGDGLLTP